MQDAAWRLEEQRRRELDKIERERRRETEVTAEEIGKVREERDNIKKKLVRPIQVARAPEGCSACPCRIYPDACPFPHVFST